MNSIRPLATITILTVVGVFLYMKIHEGPQFTSDASTGDLDISAPSVEATAAGTPSTGAGTTSALSGAAVGSTAATSSSAPPWPPQFDNSTKTSNAIAEPTALSSAAPGASAPGATAVNTPPASSINSAAVDSAANLPPVPTIPDLPPLPSQSGKGETPQTAGGLPLPANIPTASYPDSLGSAVSHSPSISGQVPSLGTATPDLAGVTQSAAAPQPTSPITTPASPVPVTATTTPIRGASPFSIARPAIDTALQRGELARAHVLLSQWLHDSSLTLEEQREVDVLLNQLAGTVIYSNEHRLEPPHTVQVGERLETIAEKYRVPWQLLAKINGIARADAVQPGQQIKVVRGPFMAEIHLLNRELILQVDGRYAGKFTITPASTSVSEGEWVVDQKLLAPVTQAVTQASTAFAATTPAVERKLVLKSVTGTAPGSTLVLGAATARQLIPGASASAAIEVSPRDADDLCDILSVGSRIVIRR